MIKRFYSWLDRKFSKTLFVRYIITSIRYFVGISILVVVAFVIAFPILYLLEGISYRSLLMGGHGGYMVLGVEVFVAGLSLYLAFGICYEGLSKEKREISKAKFRSEQMRDDLQQNFIEKNRELINQYNKEYNNFCAKAKEQKTKFLSEKCSKYFYDKEDGVYVALSKNNDELYVFEQITPKKHMIQLGAIIPPQKSYFSYKCKVPVKEINYYTNFNKEEFYSYVEERRASMKAMVGAVIAGPTGAIVGAAAGNTSEVVQVRTEKNLTSLSYGEKLLEFAPRYYLYFVELLPDKEISVAEFWWALDSDE